VSDAYLLVVAFLLMLTGSTADRLWRKRLVAVIGYATTSARAMATSRAIAGAPAGGPGG
jgi:hypothetical protein